MKFSQVFLLASVAVGSVNAFFDSVSKCEEGGPENWSPSCSYCQDGAQSSSDFGAFRTCSFVSNPHPNSDDTTKSYEDSYAAFVRNEDQAYAFDSGCVSARGHASSFPCFMLMELAQYGLRESGVSCSQPEMINFVGETCCPDGKNFCSPDGQPSPLLELTYGTNFDLNPPDEALDKISCRINSQDSSFRSISACPSSCESCKVCKSASSDAQSFFAVTAFDEPLGLSDTPGGPYPGNYDAVESICEGAPFENPVVETFSCNDFRIASDGDSDFLDRFWFVFETDDPHATCSEVMAPIYSHYYNECELLCSP